MVDQDPTLTKENGRTSWIEEHGAGYYVVSLHISSSITDTIEDDIANQRLING